MTDHEQSRRAIADHFAGRAEPRAEARMRAHLPTCARCKHRYNRHLLLASLTPGAPTWEQRLACGLGLRLRPARPFWSNARFLVAAAIPLILLIAHVRRTPTDDLRARGNAAAIEAAQSLSIYRLGSGTLVLADNWIARGDALAFAYANPAGRKYVMIFGVDEHGDVYWFQPGWPAGTPPPRSLPAVAGPGPHELPDAVKHDFDGSRLDLFALFSESAFPAAFVDRKVTWATTGSVLPLDQEGVTIVRRRLEIRP
jgi:hypothetical protein